MPAPVDEVGALAQEDVAERGVAAVARAAEQEVLAADLAREEDAVAVERHQGVRQARPGREVLRPAEAERGAVHVVAPDDVVRVVDLDEAGVVGVADGRGLALLVLPGDDGSSMIEAHAVPAPSEVEVGPAVLVVGPEDTDELAGVGTTALL